MYYIDSGAFYKQRQLNILTSNNIYIPKGFLKNNLWHYIPRGAVGDDDRIGDQTGSCLIVSRASIAFNLCHIVHKYILKPP